MPPRAGLSICDRLENLHKRYGGHVAVNNLSFAAHSGQITGLLGANGAGKTTTLRMIAGLLRPDAGTIRVPEGPHSIGALLDHTGLYARLTARENIAYFGRLRRVPDLNRRVDAVVAQLGLGPVANRRTGGFSQGERMKVALGRALVHDPRNLLLDEPTNGLDIPTVHSLRNLLRQMREEGHCIILSSHVLDDIRAVCDRIVIVSDGAVVAEGTADELCRETGCASLEGAYLHLTVSRGATC